MFAGLATPRFARDSKSYYCSHKSRAVKKFLRPTVRQTVAERRWTEGRWVQASFEPGQRPHGLRSSNGAQGAGHEPAAPGCRGLPRTHRPNVGLSSLGPPRKVRRTKPCMTDPARLSLHHLRRWPLLDLRGVRASGTPFAVGLPAYVALLGEPPPQSLPHSRLCSRAATAKLCGRWAFWCQAPVRKACRSHFAFSAEAARCGSAEPLWMGPRSALLMSRKGRLPGPAVPISFHCAPALDIARTALD